MDRQIKKLKEGCSDLVVLSYDEHRLTARAARTHQGQCPHSTKKPRPLRPAALPKLKFTALLCGSTRAGLLEMHLPFAVGTRAWCGGCARNEDHNKRLKCKWAGH